MTKIDGRDKNTAARQIEQSLGRLQTDAIDLLQFMRSFASMIRM
jgi:aryl-alcohol dehydrogenase-like predicted oxidoreductase